MLSPKTGEPDVSGRGQLAGQRTKDSDSHVVGVDLHNAVFSHLAKNSDVWVRVLRSWKGTFNVE